MKQVFTFSNSTSLQILCIDFCSARLHYSAVFFSHCQIGILVHKERLKKRERGLSVQTVGIRLDYCKIFDYYESFLFTNWCTSGLSLKNFRMYIKIDIKRAPTCFGAVTPSSGSALLVLAKVTVVKTANWNTWVCGDVVVYISGSLLVCVRCIFGSRLSMWKKVKILYYCSKKGKINNIKIDMFGYRLV